MTLDMIVLQDKIRKMKAENERLKLRVASLERALDNRSTKEARNGSRVQS